MGRKRVFGTEAVWRERLARFRDGDLKVAEFCRREGVSNASFYRWRGRLEPGNRRVGSLRRKGSKPPTTDRPERFLPVNVAGLTEAEIELPNGIKIRVPATNAEALRAAILAGHDACQGVASC